MESVFVPFLLLTISLVAFWNPSKWLQVGNSRASWSAVSAEKRPPKSSLPAAAAPVLGRTGWEFEGDLVVGVGGEEAAEVFATGRGGAEVLLDGVDV